MSESLKQYRLHDVFRCLLLIYGLIFLFASLFDYQYLRHVFSSDEPAQAMWNSIRPAQATLFCAGVALIWASASPSKPRRRRNNVLLHYVVYGMTLFLPFLVLEISLRPFLVYYPRYSKTQIYIHDKELIWKLKPNTKGVCDGVEVTINSKGLRGPELEYSRSIKAFRILFLGDSVCFGHKLESYTQTIPHLVRENLGQRLALDVESINAGVPGYSPWQQYIYLKREGVKYAPDLVVVGFVLNDVTEKFSLLRFGGKGIGKLSEAYLSFFDRLAEYSSLAFFMKMIASAASFGGDRARGAAEKETLNVRSLVSRPGDTDVHEAWRITLDNLNKIFQLCEDLGISSLLVVFPYKFQFEDMEANSIPQKTLLGFAEERGILCLDMLPRLHSLLLEGQWYVEKLYIDESHFSALGCRVVSEIIADFIQGQNIIAGKIAKDRTAGNS